MTKKTPATADIEKWLWIRVRFFPKFLTQGPDPGPKKTQNSAGVDSGNQDPVPHLVWTAVYQCWTLSGFRIAIQPDSAIHNRIGLDFENISPESDMDIQTALITAVKC